MKCSECEYGKWSTFFDGYSCKHERGLAIIFKGKTKPHKCPLSTSKYVSHGNTNRQLRGHSINDPNATNFSYGTKM